MAKIFISTPRRDHSGSSFFDECFDNLIVPSEHKGYKWQSIGGNLITARNRIIRKAIKDVDADYIFMVDDDTIFAPDVLCKLMEHDVDAVMGITLQRQSPFPPFLFDRIQNGIYHQHYLQDGELRRLIPIAGGGMGGVLIKRKVFDTIGDPYFRFIESPISADDYAEDVPFWEKFNLLGFQLYYDPGVKFHHRHEISVVAHYQNGKWTTLLSDVQPFAAVPAVKSILAIK